MKYLFLLIVISTTTNRFAKAQTNKFQEISVSQLFIWNKTTVFDIYSGARAGNKTGKAWSNGTNVNYSFGLRKNVFASIGIGYFNQRFDIHRGFNFYEPNVVTSLFYTTKNYAYKSINYFGGIGYQLKIKKGKVLPVNSEARVSIIGSFYNTFQQEFDNGGYHDPYYGNPEIRKRSYKYGSSIQLRGGIVRSVYKRFKIGIDLILPIYSRLRKDEIFKENTTEYHGINFSIGTSINLIYNLKK